MVISIGLGEKCLQTGVEGDPGCQMTAPVRYYPCLESCIGLQMLRMLNIEVEVSQR